MTAAIGAGYSDRRVFFRHLLPNVYKAAADLRDHRRGRRHRQHRDPELPGRRHPSSDARARCAGRRRSAVCHGSPLSSIVPWAGRRDDRRDALLARSRDHAPIGDVMTAPAPGRAPHRRIPTDEAGCVPVEDVSVTVTSVRSSASSESPAAARRRCSGRSRACWRGERCSVGTLALEAPRSSWGDSTRISMISQDPMTGLNPVLTVGEQICEVPRRRDGLSKSRAGTRDRPARRSRHPGRDASTRLLPAPAVRWPTAASADRRGAVGKTRTAAVRRTDHRPRRHGAGEVRASAEPRRRREDSASST